MGNVVQCTQKVKLKNLNRDVNEKEMMLDKYSEDIVTIVFESVNK